LGDKTKAVTRSKMLITNLEYYLNKKTYCISSEKFYSLYGFRRKKKIALEKDKKESIPNQVSKTQVSKPPLEIVLISRVLV